MGETSPWPRHQRKILSASLQGHIMTEGLQLKDAGRTCAFLWDNLWSAQQVFKNKIKPELGQKRNRKNKARS